MLNFNLTCEQYYTLKKELEKVGVRTRYSIMHVIDRTVEGIQFDNPHQTAEPGGYSRREGR